MKDLIMLTADKSMQQAIEGILRRPESLGIRRLHPADYQIIVHPYRDPAVVREGAAYLQSQTDLYRYALLVCDRHGSGMGDLTRAQIEERMEADLNRQGWSGRSAAVVIDPELEIWAWSDSPHVEKILGWNRADITLREWMITNGYLKPEQVKPLRPQECLDSVLELTRKRRTSAIFGELASTVSLNRCTDGAFRKRADTLRAWFPP